MKWRGLCYAGENSRNFAWIDYALIDVKTMLIHRLLITLLLVLSGVVFLSAQSTRPWWSPGNGNGLPASASYENTYGRLTILNTAGRIETRFDARPVVKRATGRTRSHQTSTGRAATTPYSADRTKCSSCDSVPRRPTD